MYQPLHTHIHTNTPTNTRISHLPHSCVNSSSINMRLIMLKYVLRVKMLPLHNPPTETHPHPPNQLFRHFCCLLLIGHGWWAIIKSVCVCLCLCVCVCVSVCVCVGCVRVCGQPKYKPVVDIMSACVRGTRFGSLSDQEERAGTC